jgi:polypeptide N-acetylgalactosaminyltransferase
MILYLKWFAPFNSPQYVDKIRSLMRRQPQETTGFFDKPTNVMGMKIDWHNYRQMADEKRRTGIGENGQPASLSSRNEEQEKKASLENGFNALLSDKISVNRSVPDLRHEE